MTLFGGAPGGCKGGRSGDVVNTTGNHEQVAALPSRQRMISVFFRPAALPTMAAQTSKAVFGIRLAGAAPNRPPLPHAGQASQSPFRRKNYAPEVQRNTTPNTLLISSAVRLRIFAGGSDHCDSGGLESAPNLQGSMPVWMFG